MIFIDILGEGDWLLHELIDSDSGLEVLADGFQYTEGPVWDAARNRLIFSDIPGNSMWSWSDLHGLRPYRIPSKMANGNLICRDGSLISCEQATSRLVREGTDGSLNIIADRWNGCELNSPNDLVERSDGLIYFTDPTYGRQSFAGVERPIPLPFRGLFRLDPASGDLTLMAKDFIQPNGLCFSPDQRYLFVNDSEAFHIRRFVVNSDGNLSGGDCWVKTVGTGFGSPDGMKTDHAGNVFCCAQGGIQVFSPDAVFLGTIRTPEEAGNLAFGAAGFDSLFITASTRLLRARLKSPAFPPI